MRARPPELPGLFFSPVSAMSRITPLLFVTLSLFGCAAYGQSSASPAQLLPKYGRTESEIAATEEDRSFLAGSDQLFKGDRKQAAKAMEVQGWKWLRQNKSGAAMQCFNKAWLLDAGNGNALWGMGQIEANRGHANESLALFNEANRRVGFDIDFAVDFARAQSLAGIKLGDNKLMDEAFRRFAQIQTRAPQHTLNLQNWAIALYYTGKFGQAWDKIKAAQATPRGAEVDKKFMADLQAKMPRP